MGSLTKIKKADKKWETTKFSKSPKHYHLQVQANSKKIAQKKTMLFLASMGKTGLTHEVFFEFSVGPFEVVEAEGGRLVKEADFEAEKKIYYKK